MRCINAAPTLDLVDSCEQADGVSSTWAWNPDAGSSALTQARGVAAPRKGSRWRLLTQRRRQRMVLPPCVFRTRSIFTWRITSPVDRVRCPRGAMYIRGHCVRLVHRARNDRPRRERLAPLRPDRECIQSGLTGYLKLTRSDLQTSQVYCFPLSGTELFTFTQLLTKSLNASLLQEVGVTTTILPQRRRKAAFDCRTLCPGMFYGSPIPQPASIIDAFTRTSAFTAA